MMPNLNISGFTIQVYPLLLLVAIWVGLWLAAREARRLGLNSDHVYNLGFYGLAAMLLGARLTYVLSHWAAYQDSLLAVLSPTPTALAWSEGILIGGLVAIIYWSKQRLPVAATLDALAPGLALALGVIRLGAFLDGSAIGTPTRMPWGIYLWNDVRHPVQLYELAALLVILGIVWRQRTRRPFAGHTFVLFVALYAGSRWLLEAFRADTPVLAGGVRTVQVIALAIMLAAVWYLYRRHFAPLEQTSSGRPGPPQVPPSSSPLP